MDSLERNQLNRFSILSDSSLGSKKSIPKAARKIWNSIFSSLPSSSSSSVHTTTVSSTSPSSPSFPSFPSSPSSPSSPSYPSSPTFPGPTRSPASLDSLAPPYPPTTAFPDLYNTFPRSRSKHKPILIPHYAQPQLDEKLLYYCTPVLHPSSSISSPRIRHVEIKLADWVTAKYFPTSPQTSSTDFDSIFSHQERNSRCDSLETDITDAYSLECFLNDTIEPSYLDSLTFPTPPTMSGPSPTQSQLLQQLPPGRANTQPALYRILTEGMTPDGGQLRSSASTLHNPSPAGLSPAANNPSPSQLSSSNIGLSGFVCNVHRTTGREPKPLVGATTTIIGDKLYVFGGRRVTRNNPQLTSDLYELDLLRRHWTKVECKGEIPPPRYFHSVCALGDTKLVCYGGMSQSDSPDGNPSQNSQDTNQAPSMDVMSDIHILDLPTTTWRKIVSANAPQGRYAHCATILPSSAVFASQKASHSAIQHNPQSNDTPNQGKLGVSLDGTGGAELVVVGGQDPANHYIEQISVFNLRSLRWTSISPLGRQCGAYRTVTTPLSSTIASQIGMGHSLSTDGDRPPDGGSAMLIYSNYNFLDVKLELQIHLADGTLIEKPMQGGHSPPGLRFPNGGVIDNHFVVSGTLLTSYKQEYALWALDLRTLMWNRIDIGSQTFSQGSWNRGVLWSRRNAFVILGNRKRSLVEDYNHRRVNFSNLCVVELEAFGLYDNPRQVGPMSGYRSASSPSPLPSLSNNSYSSTHGTDRFAAGRRLSKAAEELGKLALGNPELADMDFLAINGERIPANSRIILRRWGPYFTTLLREAIIAAEAADASTLRPSNMSAVTSIMSPSVRSGGASGGGSSSSGLDSFTTNNTYASNSEIPELAVNQATRPRTVYLPHTPLTIQALLHFLYTSSLPPLSSHLCTPQILCSLLQIARPYKIDGLLESVVERLHSVLDNRNTAAIFNAAAMAAGGGEGVEFVEDRDGGGSTSTRKRIGQTTGRDSPILGDNENTDENGTGDSSSKRRASESEGESDSPDLSNKDVSDSESDTPNGEQKEEVWSGNVSAVVGLQKRGLRGLMEGRRIREMGNSNSRDVSAGGERVGLGIERS